MTDDVPAQPTDPAAFLADAWSRLVRGAADRRCGFHTVQLATLAADGPRARTVVLRGADPAAGTLRLHTDARSPKAAEIAADPRVELVAYDARWKLQVRARGTATLHAEDAVADAAWAATGPGSRTIYRTPSPPGADLSDAADGDLTEALRSAAEDAGRENFRVVLVAVARLDILSLAAAGHRRAAFVRGPSGWTGGWLAP